MLKTVGWPGLGDSETIGGGSVIVYNGAEKELCSFMFKKWNDVHLRLDP